LPGLIRRPIGSRQTVYPLDPRAPGFVAAGAPAAGQAFLRPVDEVGALGQDPQPEHPRSGVAEGTPGRGDGADRQ